MPLERVSDDFLKNVKRLSPYGLDNPQPLFLDKNIEFVGTKKFGVENRHFKTFLKKDDKIYSAVAFNCSILSGVLIITFSDL